jgi:hypothetical protein
MTVDELCDHFLALSQDGYGKCKVGWEDSFYGWEESKIPLTRVVKVAHGGLKVGEEIVEL